MVSAVRDFFLNGGSEAIGVCLVGGTILTPADYAGDGVGTGLFALEKVDLFNLLCLPPATFDGETVPDTPVKVYQTALYFPRILEADPLRGGQAGAFVPCGIVAGVMSRTDAQHGVWKAPAGIEAFLSGTVGLEHAVTDGENGRLNALGVNCLRTFPAPRQRGLGRTDAGRCGLDG